MSKQLKDLATYGDVLAYALKGFLWSYKTYGDYQGDYFAVIEKNHIIYIYKGNYGSCSGCDWLHDNNELTEEAIADYMKEFHPFLEIPKDSLPDTAEELEALFPANTRIDYEFERIKQGDLFDQLKNPEPTNLDYLEWRHEQNLLEK